MVKVITKNDIAKHPCFDVEARHTHARVHLPVAPRCNIQCNYCNRKYDCVNESRPGVTSSVLDPFKAVTYLKELNKHIPNISVVGIAGPGDPFANPDEVLKTLRAVKAEFPDKIFCLSTNGLNLEPYIDEIAALDVTHVTLTINGVRTDITSKIYRWVRYNKKVYRGEEAAALLLEKQLACIPLLKAKGITVKINFIIIPGINDHHIDETTRVVKGLGADLINCMPLIPTAGSNFEDMPKPDQKMIFRVRAEAKHHLPIMTHCARCRADAAGLLGQDMKEAYTILQQVSSSVETGEENRPYVAVATYEGHLVNLHLGEAKSVYIFRQTPNGFQYVEEREMPDKGGGDQRWIDVARLLIDCRAILVAGVGENPASILKECGIRVVQMTGMIDEGLDGIYNNLPIRSIKKADAFRCGSGCSGNAQGCA